MPDTNVTLTSDGIVVTDFGRFPLLTKELFSLFAQLDKRAFPGRYFDHTDPALDWLRRFL